MINFNEDPVLSLKRLYSHTSSRNIRAKIRKFREIDFKNISRGDLNEEISKVLRIQIPLSNQSIYSMLQMFEEYQVSEQFYRVRKIDVGDPISSPSCMQTESDAWNAPSKICRAGRLNLERESLLYTSPKNYKVALDEMGVEEKEPACIIVYEAKQNINAIDIVPCLDDTFVGRIKLSDRFNEHEQDIYDSFNDFLRDEFTRIVAVGSEYLYKISEIIIKDYFDLPPQVQDAWKYPSIKNRKLYNVCFRPEKAREKLHLRGVLVGERGKLGDFDVKFVTEVNKYKKMVYYPIGSADQKRIFPEI